MSCIRTWVLGPRWCVKHPMAPDWVCRAHTLDTVRVRYAEWVAERLAGRTGLTVRQLDQALQIARDARIERL